MSTCFVSGTSAQLLDLVSSFEQHVGCVDSNVCVQLLKACGKARALVEGRRVDARIQISELAGNIFINNHILQMYSRCRRIDVAEIAFQKMQWRNVFSWNAMIQMYAQWNLADDALRFFFMMLQEGTKPDSILLVNLLTAFTQLQDLSKTKLAHLHIIQNGFDSNEIVATALITSYHRCGSLDDARCVFNRMSSRNPVTWTAMITAYAAEGHLEETFNLFVGMLKNQVSPSRITFSSILSCCDSPLHLTTGKIIHNCIIESGLESNVFVNTALLSMYSKCGDLKNAKAVFYNLQSCDLDLIAWNAMIAAYAQHQQCEEALELFGKMQQEGIHPDKITLVTILSIAAAATASVTTCNHIHARIIEQGVESNLVVGNAMITAYSRCGDIEMARTVFNGMSNRDTVTWTSMITASAQHGYFQEALQLFKQMQRQKIQPDGATCVAFLSACAHCGFVRDGREFFESMESKLGIKPTIAHYGCMIDLLGREGNLQETENFINAMPIQADAAAWTTLLTASKRLNDTDRATRAAHKLMLLHPSDPTSYNIMLSNSIANSTVRKREYSIT